MLQNLEVLNGKLSPNFDALNYLYTVHVTNDVSTLELNYEAPDDSEVKVFGNDNLKEGENSITIEVRLPNELNTYTILVTKEKTMNVNKTLITSEPLEVKKELPSYVAPLIAIICFGLILFSFGLIFHKKKHKK